LGVFTRVTIPIVSVLIMLLISIYITFKRGIFLNLVFNLIFKAHLNIILLVNLSIGQLITP